MSRKSISWILDFTSKLPNKEEKINCLRANETVVAQILQYAYSPNIEWLLPETDPPYVPNEHQNQEHMMYGELRKLYLFVKGGNDNLEQVKRERLFIDMLEAVCREDAEMLLAAKNKKLPYKGLNAKIVQEAFPGIF